MNALNIYAIRHRSRRTQEQFANALGIPPNTLRSWEQQRKRPSGAARALLRLIEQKPELLESLTESGEGKLWPGNNYWVAI
jgi:DNA-binding transcriptional regulator YiaG